MTDHSSPAAIGSVFADRYRLDRLLGRGGMGAVYEAFDLSLGRIVALKTILPERATHPESVERFLREARAAAALQHPGIPTIHDVGRVATPYGPTPFLVMERLHGESLADRLRRGPLSVPEATRIAVAILGALGAAHEAGVVHRDVKPDNVFLRAPDAHPMLLDFGVARIVEDDGGAALTREGQSLGTPLYMAPEQLAGQRVGTRADLYALGAVLYEAVTGWPTYQAETFTGLVTAKMTQEPNAALLHSVVGDGPFARAVMQALARDPTVRPATADAMARALLDAAPRVDAWAATVVSTDGHGAARPRSASEATPRPATPSASHGPVSRRRVGALAFAGLGLVVAGLAASALAYVVIARRAPTPTPVLAPSLPGLVPILNAEPTPPRLALSVLRDLRDATGSRRTLLENVEVWEQCVADLEIAVRQPTIPARWRAALEFCRGQAQLLRAAPGEALAHFDRAIALDASWPEPHVFRAEACLGMGRDEDAVASLRAASRLDPAWWLPMSKLGSVYARTGRGADAIVAYRRAHDAAPGEPRVLDSLALTYHGEGMDSLADETAAAALALDPGAPWSHLIRAERALERGDGEAALVASERAAASLPSAPVVTLARADALALLRRTDEAESAYRALLGLVGAQTASATGLPAGRIDLVREALDAGRLPPPRHRPSAAARAGSGGRRPPIRRSEPNGMLNGSGGFR